jgi:phosphatidylinositol alpha-1,6-mannosyltransferase
LTVKGSHALLVSELFPPAVGGSAVLFEGIYSRLQGADVTVVTDGTRGAGVVRQGRFSVVRRPFLHSRWGVLDPTSLRSHLGMARELRQLTTRRGGLVHCARALPEGVAAMLAHLAGGPRYVCWAHGEDLSTAMNSREFTWLTKAVYRHAVAALANSHNTAEMLASLGVARAKIHIVHPAVDADRFHPRVDGSDIRRRYARPDEVLLLSVGRLQRRKGHDVAIEAIGLLRDECPNLRYVIAGDGDERTRLESLAAAHGVQDRVIFAGIVDDAELPAYYGACDIFLLPNREDEGDIEGFGIVFLEAAATGKPVIGGNSGGVPEAIERGVTGLLVEGADARSVAAGIRALATSEDMRRRMGAAGRLRAQSCFRWERAAEAVSQLHARLMLRAS